MLGSMPGGALASQGVSGAEPAPARAFGVVRSARLRYLLGVFSLAAVYYGAAHLGYAFEFAGPVAAILWLPVGVGIAFLRYRDQALRLIKYPSHQRRWPTSVWRGRWAFARRSSSSD